ncbi:hypothetical protein M0805_003263 [Coniferiporia weirii]|nr:hypothetical protein M0805_003263 [Coniferiporia weirii]
MATDGASSNERLLAAARQDNEELLLEIFEEGGFNINYKDGYAHGDALHYAASFGSTDVLEHILTHEDCDVDPINRLEGATPLHLALGLKDPELRDYVVENLLEAGADTTIKNKDGDTAMDLLDPRTDDHLSKLMRKARASNSVAMEDIADDDDEGSVGSGSESD